MRRTMILMVVAACAAGRTVAQERPGARNPRPSEARAPEGESSLVSRMMAFDANKDGKLSKDEVSDSRLLRLFDRADTNKDGEVTLDELTAIARTIEAQKGGRRGGGQGGFGPGAARGGGAGAGDGAGRGGFGPGGPGGRGPSGGEPGGMRGLAQPGQLLPAGIRESLDVTADQNRQLDELQKEIDGRLAKILTEDQRRELARMRGPGPGDRGGPIGRGGFGPGGRGGRRGAGGPPEREQDR
jgi:EF hand